MESAIPISSSDEHEEHNSPPLEIAFQSLAMENDIPTSSSGEHEEHNSPPLEIKAPAFQSIVTESDISTSSSDEHQEHNSFNSPPLEINAPAIVLVGKTGAGKSMLGNLLLKTSEDDEPTFYVSDGFGSATKKSGSAIYKIGDEIYNIVDTPGLFDTDDLNDEILEEIARTIQKCAHGVKAILFVFEARRLTEEQKNVVNGIKIFLGEEAFQYMILVFSHCNKKQTRDIEYFRKSSWNGQVRGFVNSMGNRWAISPNPEIFPPDDPVHQQHLEKLRNVIATLDGVYTNEILERAQKRQEENKRIEREAEEKRQKEYDELKRREGEAVAETNYLRQKKEGDEKAHKAREEELRKLREDLNNHIEDLNTRIWQLHQKTEQLTQENEQKAEQLSQLSQEKENLLQENQDLSQKNKKFKKEIDEYKNNKCFWLETQVKLESGKIIQTSKLQVGDRVLSNVRNGIEEFSDVYLIAHIGKLDHEEKFTKVSFTRPDDSKGQLRLTSTHYIFNENLSIIFAKNLRPGETKILVLDNNDKLVPVFVDDITNEWHDGYISFYTRAGSVIADGVLCSCYDHCPPSQTLMDLVFLPIRWWTHIMPSTHREERLHPYVKFLETAYLSFVNAMKKGKQFIEN